MTSVCLKLFSIPNITFFGNINQNVNKCNIIKWANRTPQSTDGINTLSGTMTTVYLKVCKSSMEPEHGMFVCALGDSRKKYFFTSFKTSKF